MRQTALCLAALACLFAACPKTTTPVDAGRTGDCTTRADCAAGKVCTAQNYCDVCSSSGQCSLKEECQVDGGLCALRAGWGTDCGKNEDCQAGSWCKQGLCVDRSQVSLCTGGTNAECPQGERCNKLTTVCEEDLGCSTDDDCSTGEVCNTGSRACTPRCTTETQATVCAGAEKCVGNHCAQCATSADCGAGLTCDAAGNCNAGNVCYTDRDCTVPLVCYVQTGTCLEKAPPCITDDACTATQRCDVPSGKCVPRTCQPDRYEPDDDAAHAFGVSAQTYTGLTLCQGDQDWYSLSLARGDQLGVNLDADLFAETTFSTVVKDGSGRTLASGHLLTSYIAAIPATYYVVVSSTDAFQRYNATFLLSRGTPCDDDSYEPNDLSTQATALNQATQVDGAICPQDADWFKVSVPGGHGLTASLINYDSGKGLLSLCVFAADGTTSLGCTDAATSPQVALTAAQVSGTAYVRVAGSTDRVANPYTLKVELP
jgi:hypothetical protein